MTAVGTRVRVNHPGMAFHGRVGTIVGHKPLELPDVANAEVLAVVEIPGFAASPFLLPADWLRGLNAEETEARSAGDDPNEAAPDGGADRVRAVVP